MDHKEKYIAEKLEQAGRIEQDPTRAHANINQIRNILQSQARRQHQPHRFGIKVAAAVIIAVGLFFVFQPPWGNSNVAWADVVEQFKSMSFYNAVLYYKEDAASEPKQIELWVSSKHQARLRVDSQVLFADKGKIVAGYNFKNKRVLDEMEYDEMGQAIIESLCQRQTLSLDEVVGMVCKGQLQDVTPGINSDAMISQDLLVFDLQSTISPEWMRIWALRESNLPVRLRQWDPRDGECMDVFVTYEKQQPADFFDYKKYEKLLLETSRTGGSLTNLAYALLKDPGGQNYVPEDLFNESGYHMPQVEQVGMTEYGAVWVIASKAMNSRPDGRMFFGFSEVTDDLGRTYRQVASSHLTMDDMSPQIFIPEDYPFDKRVPAELTLTCDVETLYRFEEIETIGTETLTEWLQDSQLPSKWFTQSETNVFLNTAYRCIEKEEYETAESIVQLIKVSPDADQFAHKLNKLQLRKLLRQERYEEAEQLTEQLWPVEMELFKKPQARPNVVAFYDFIRAYAATGNVEKATKLWGKLKAFKPDFSMYSKGAQKHLTEDLKNAFELRHDPAIINDLFDDYNLTLSQVNQIFGFDLSTNESTKHWIPQDYSHDVTEWDKYLIELAQYYKANPLEPGQMEFRKRAKYNRISNFKMPELEDYRVYPVGGTLRNYAKYSHYPDSLGRVKFDDEIEDVQLQHAIVMNGEVEPEKQRAFVLSQYGLEMVPGEDECTVWIAEYDDRELPDYQTLHELSLRSDQPGGMVSMTGSGMSLESLFFTLMDHQDIVVENETGLDDKTKMSIMALNFKGQEGAELAEKWYRDNFGITFRKEQRRMPVWIVRKKKDIEVSDTYPVKGYMSDDDMVEYYQAHPLEPGQVAFHSGLHKEGLVINYSIPDHKFMKLGTSVRHFAQNYHHPPYGRFRFEKGVADIFVQYDIVYRKDVTMQTIVELVLSKAGLEIIETEDDCTVWVAEYNNQELKPWGSVKCPIPNTKKIVGLEPSRPGTVSGMGVFTIDVLLNHLAQDQDMIVENNTGIDKEKYISGVIPNFTTVEGADLAKTWYLENFGITLHQEQRRVLVWTVRNKQ